MNPVQVIIHGSRGRMGRALAECARSLAGVQVVGEVDLGDDLAAAAPAQVVIDFSFHEATRGVAGFCAERGLALVVGTTGHTDAEKDALRTQAQRVPMVWSANYSTGVNTLFWLTRKAAEVLGPGFDLEVIEMHHRMKKDAPSGTAASLAEILCEVRGWQPAEALRHGREGITGERTANEIGMHALRGGDVVGDHTVVFAAQGERVELTHRAASRDTFAAGALRAAAWVVGRAPGIYSMQHVLGL